MFSLSAIGPWWAWFFEFAALMVPLGGLVAGFIFGTNLYLTCAYADMNHNDAFGALRLDLYRHFLRLKIIGNQITVYPVGLTVRRLATNGATIRSRPMTTLRHIFCRPTHLGRR